MQRRTPEPGMEDWVGADGAGGAGGRVGRVGVCLGAWVSDTSWLYNLIELLHLTLRCSVLS